LEAYEKMIWNGVPLGVEKEGSAEDMANR
jgi:hypothetical protein